MHNLVTEPVTASLYGGFARAAQRTPSRPALMVDGRTLTYAELAELAARVSGAIGRTSARGGPLVAVLANRSLSAYLGVLGSLAGGRGYVPLNPKHPVDRLRRVLASADVDVLIVGREGLALLPALLEGRSAPLAILAPESPASDLGPFTKGPALGSAEVAAHAPADPAPDVPADALAYLLFTSGSTGEPKGVAVTHANVRAYARHLCERMGANESDRFSQMSDLSFDWSVHDLYVCWEAGACLCSISEQSHMAPAKLIRELGITMWAAVPSVVGVMRGMRMLKPGAFPSVRYTVFCGEPLPADYAAAWQAAAPNSVVENLYGPTEATVAITGYRWDSVTSPADCPDGVVPIGWAFPAQACAVVDEGLRPVTSGEPGELCLGGSQVTAGYWRRPEETAARFVHLPGHGTGRWYRTGDLARQGPNGCLYYLGRMDDQVKIRGYRVELQEIDHAVRAAAPDAMVATVAWPASGGSAEGVVAFVAGAASRDPVPVLAACRQRLPEYMVPREIVFLETLPLSPNGKVDRRELVRLLTTRKG